MNKTKVEVNEETNARTRATALPPTQGAGKRAVKEENYPMEVNEVSQVDEGKIAAKRGQCFLFSLFPLQWQAKNGLGQDFRLPEDGRLHAVR